MINNGQTKLRLKIVVVGEREWAPFMRQNHNCNLSNMTRDKNKEHAFSIRGLLELLTIVYTRFIEDNYPRVAGSLSYITLLAIVPLLSVVFSIASTIPFFQHWILTIQPLLFDTFMPETNEVVWQYLVQFTENANELTKVGIGFLFLSSLVLFASVEEAFNDICRIEKKRHWAQRFIVYMLVIVVGPILIVSSLWMTMTLTSFLWVDENALFHVLGDPISKYLPVLLELFAFTCLYKFVPNRIIQLTKALYGAIFAVLLFQLGKLGFSIYVANFGSYDLIYGALATIPVFLLWIYVSWTIVLVGVLVTAVLVEQETTKLPD